MKSILIVTASVPNGLPSQGTIIAQRLRDEGVRVTLLGKSTSRLGRLLHVVCRVFWLAPFYDVVLVDVFGEKAFVYESFAILCAWLWRRRTIAMLHNGMFPEFVGRWPRWTNFVLSRPDLVFVPHGFLQDQLAAAAIHIDGIIPNFVQIDRYRFRKRSVLAPRFLYLRGLHPVYNPEMALRAFALIQRRYPDASITMAGPEGPSSRDCRALVGELGIRNVEFLGLVPKCDIPSLGERHDIHLHSNRFDNMPVSIIEMWACGLPIVGTRVGGVPYLIKDGVDGLLVSSENYQAMATACLQILSDPCLAENLSVNGRARAEGLTWDAVKPLWYRVLFGSVSKSAELSGASIDA